MAAAHDTQTATAAYSSIGTQNTTHTPVGTPRGVVVVILQGGIGDQVSGVTYGGVAMTRVLRQTSNVGDPETGEVWIYFLGSGIPSGAQTVGLTTTGTNAKLAVISTVTANADTEVDTSAGAAPGVVSNPSLTVATTAGVSTCIYYGIFSGLAAPVTTAQAGSTHQFGSDRGQFSFMWARKTHTGGSTTIGYTANSDDVNHAAVAVKEAVVGTAFEEFPADTLSLSDSETEIHGIGNVVTPGDNAAVADSLVARDVGLGHADAAALADAVAKTFEQLSSDPLNLSDASGLGVVRPAADSVGVADAPTTQTGKEANPADTLTLSDAAAFSFMESLADSLPVADAIALAREVLVGVDSASAADSATPARGISQSPSDSLGLADAPTVVRGLNALPADVLVLADTAARGVGRTVADTLALADAALTARDLNVLRADTLVLSDGTVIASGWSRLPADVAALADSASSAAGWAAGGADSLVLIDDTARSLGLARSVADAVALLDEATPEIFLSAAYIHHTPPLDGQYERPLDGVVLALVRDGTVTIIDSSGVVATATKSGIVIPGGRSGIVEMPLSSGDVDEDPRSGGIV